ncbi:unnamed protein product [Phytomonas sp. EM1]|nr:unnamed protein product [Phytomonas sp. EM1]|eukprot:CCW60629.1 unnamed protein product [Phytomonas sp. isolate EM1]
MTFSFNVMFPTGQKFLISVLGPDNTVGDIKTKMEEADGIPRSMICLVHAGRKLEDDSTLASCGIQAGVTINMVLALRAG